jgi:predicted SAM-dependent methyltransferase
MAKNKTAKKQIKHAPIDPATAALMAPQTPVLAKPEITLKLDLACGQNIREGFEGVDMPTTPGIAHGVDLTKFPWPWADSSVLELHSSHFVEHLPMEFVDANGNYVPCGTTGSRDLFFAFFDECHRILVPGGWMQVIVPCLRNNRAFQDPTHRRFLPAEAFLYLAKAWRDANKLDHYNVKCDFEINVSPTIPVELSVMTEEVQTNRMQNYWNQVVDLHAKLKAVK